MRLRAHRSDRSAGYYELFEHLVPSDMVVLVARGELDVAAVPELRARLEGVAPGKRLLMDLLDVTFIDSLSLAAIVAAKRRMGPEGRMALAADHHYVLLILEAGGLESVVEIFPTRDQAQAYLLG